jgi:hypothetical protein
MAANHARTSLELKQVKLTHAFVTDKKRIDLVLHQFELQNNEKLPAQKAGGLYKTHSTDVLWFCRGHPVLGSSGRRGHVSIQIETLSTILRRAIRGCAADTAKRPVQRRDRRCLE